MRKKLNSVLLCFALVAGLMAAFPVVAQADSTSSPTSFHPDEDGTSTSRGNILADRFDGTDATAHLTAVTNSVPERVQWRICPIGVNEPGPGGGGITAAELASCNIIIGEDTSPTVPGTSGVFTTADEAWDINYDIPASLDGQIRDVLILGCVGSGEVTDPGAGTVNCQTKLEENIFFDDANTGEPDVTTGEMVSYCTSDTDALGGPGGGAPNNAANDPCEQAYSTGTGPGNTDAQIAARFKAFPHGSPLPNNGFVIRATTSTDVTDLRAARDYNPPADADTDPDAADEISVCTNLQTQADRITWECIFMDQGVADDNASQAVWIFNFAGGTLSGAEAGPGDCNTSAADATDRCTLDSHLGVSGARRASTVRQSWIPGGGGVGHTHQPPSPPANAGCQPGETETSAHSNSQLGWNENGEICMEDQFGDPFSGAYTEEVGAPGTCASGGHDHDGDGRLEHCHGGTGADGRATFNVANFNSTPGTSNITSCFEGEVQAGATPPADHGCADEATGVKDTLTLTWGTQPQEVFLAFTDPAPTNPSDPCRTGITFKRNNVGDTDNLIVCTYDSNGNPIATDTNGFRITWTVTSPTNEPTTVRFNGSPPQETSGADGTANTSIVAERQGNNFINVFLDNVNGNQVDSFTIEKQVEGENQPQNVPTNLTARKAKRKVRGKAATPRAAECRVNRQVTLFKRTPGPNQVIGQDTTNNFGRWAIRVPKPRRGRYYARVSASQATDNTGQTLNCLADQSDDVRWRKRRR